MFHVTYSQKQIGTHLFRVAETGSQTTHIFDLPNDVLNEIVADRMETLSNLMASCTHFRNIFDPLLPTLAARIESLSSLVSPTEITWLAMFKWYKAIRPLVMYEYAQIPLADRLHTILDETKSYIPSMLSLRQLEIASNQLDSLYFLKDYWDHTKISVFWTRFTFTPENETTLDLKATQLLSLPRQIGQLTNLLDLCCDGGQVRSLPRELRSCTRIQKLNIASNLFQQIPECVEYMPYLSKINLSRNKIKILSPIIGSCFNLKILLISHNPLTQLPDIFDRFQYLQYFACAYCQLEELPPSILKCDRLTTLLCPRNKIKVVPVWKNYEAFHRFHFHGNLITEWPPNLDPKNISRSDHIYSSKFYLLPQGKDLSDTQEIEEILYELENEL